MRFVESEFIAIRNFLTDLPLIVAELNDELDKVALKKELRVKISDVVRQIRQMKFVEHLVIMSDIMEVAKGFSRQVQSDSSCIIALPRFRAALRERLESLRHSLGPEARRRLSSLAMGKLVMNEAGHAIADPRNEVAVTEDEQTGAGAAEIGKTKGELKLLGQRGEKYVKGRLLSFQRQYVDVLLDNFDQRLPEIPMAVHMKNVFDFSTMPLENHKLLMEWGVVDLDALCGDLFPTVDAALTQTEFLAVKVFVRDQQARFLQWKDPKDRSAGKVLLVTGPGSIFELLFSRSDVLNIPIPNYLHLADYMISCMWHSCSAERAGSHINLVKTKTRTQMSDELLNSLVFNTVNMPDLHEMDFDAIVDNWRRSGARMGSGEQGGSKVVQRHLGQTTPTFLFKKPSASTADASAGRLSAAAGGL